MSKSKNAKNVVPSLAKIQRDVQKARIKRSKQHHTTSFMLFDGRYLADEDSTMCLNVCDTLSEAKEVAPDYGDDTVIVKVVFEGDIEISRTIIN